MSEDWEYTEQEDNAMDEVKEENESKPSSEHLNSENSMQANATIVEDQTTKAGLDNNEEHDKVIKVEDTAVKSLPRATTTTTTMSPIDKTNSKKKSKRPLRNQKQQRHRKEITMPKISKQLHKQDVEIKKLKSILQSQSEAIKQLKSQLKQMAKQT